MWLVSTLATVVLPDIGLKIPLKMPSLKEYTSKEKICLPKFLSWPTQQNGGGSSQAP